MCGSINVYPVLLVDIDCRVKDLRATPTSNSTSSGVTAGERIYRPQDSCVKIFWWIFDSCVSNYNQSFYAIRDKPLTEFHDSGSAGSYS